jgi:hypothetical protein
VPTATRSAFRLYLEVFGSFISGLTPELSRPAREAEWSLEATKRVRLE